MDLAAKQDLVSTIIRVLVTDWTLMRVLRVLAGVALLVAAWIKRDTLVMAFGLLFLYQGLFNIRGCGMGGCATGSCGIPQDRNRAEADQYR